MKARLTFLLLLLLVLSTPTEAQVPSDGPTSIGFSAPDSTQPVRAYRLPAWQWSRWTLGGDGNLQWSTSETEQQEQSLFSTGLSVDPRYEGFWESEERTASLSFSPSVVLDTRSSSADSENFEEREFDRTEYVLAFDSEGTLREYVRERTFVLAEGGADLRYRRNHKDSNAPSETQIESGTILDGRLGVGFGRVRVVTPVIRALRVRERLRTVVPGASMSDDQVQAAANQLARRPGYRAVYDRPDKLFWRDFFETAGLADRSTFKTFYVADVLRELVAVRREGGEVQVGMSGSYRRSLDREERDGNLIERSLSDTENLGVFARGQWYRNLTLRHQIGADATARYTNVLDPDDDLFRTRLTGEWLWMLADRVRLDTQLRAFLSYQKVGLRDRGYRTNQQYRLSSDLLVFVENSLSLSAGGNVRYRHDEDAAGEARSDFDVGMQFRVTYVLSRALR